jgi:hypothetical protein
MKDNPIYRFSKRELKAYQKHLLLYGKKTRQMLRKHTPTPYNQAFLQRWLFKIADGITHETQQFLVEVIDEVVDKTITVYNNLHKGEKLRDFQIIELRSRILKEFLLSEFKGKTLDQRISHSNRRIKVNLQRELQNLITDRETGSKGEINNLINSITGTDYKEGGTALRWNSRLVLSELYRAYQFTGKVVLAELGVDRVAWMNSPRHEEKGSLIDEYAEKVYTPNELPEYPYPCNDSYFIPIYKD